MNPFAGLIAPRDSVGPLLVSQKMHERDDRRRRINEAWDRYWGKHPDPLTKTATDPKGDDNTIVNLARKTVDIGAFYLFGKGIDIELGDEEQRTGESGGEPPAEDWLEKAIDASGGVALLLEWATSGSVAGDAYLRLYPANPLEGEVYPRIVMLDGANVDVQTDPVDYNKPTRFLIEFVTVDTETAKATNHRHRIEREGNGWLIVEEESGTQGNTWVEVSREAWPYPFAPIVHAKNLSAPHSYYGRSDIEGDVLGINDAISFVVSNINRILRVHGHPQLYIAGQGSGSEIDRAIDNVLYFPNPEAKVGATPYIDDLKSHFEQLQKLRDAYHELTQIPEITTGKTENLGQLSGLALQILYGPLVQLINVKRIFYGEALRRAAFALLTLGAQDTSLPIKIKWPQILPVNRQEEAQTAVTLKEAGVSEETVLTELGYDAKTEMEKTASEAKEKADAMAAQFDAGGVPGQPPVGRPVA